MPEDEPAPREGLSRGCPEATSNPASSPLPSSRNASPVCSRRGASSSPGRFSDSKGARCHRARFGAHEGVFRGGASGCENREPSCSPPVPQFPNRATVALALPGLGSLMAKHRDGERPLASAHPPTHSPVTTPEKRLFHRKTESPFSTITHDAGPEPPAGASAQTLTPALGAALGTDGNSEEQRGSRSLRRDTRHEAAVDVSLPRGFTAPGG